MLKAATAYEHLGEAHWAVPLYRSALELDAGNAFALERLRAHLSDAGEWRAVADLLAGAAASTAPGTTAERRARYAADAADVLLRGLDDEDAAKEALYRTAVSLAGDEHVFELLHRIFEIDPAYPPMLRFVADYHRADGEPGEAQRFYTRYLDAAPGAHDASVVHLRLAQIALGYEEEEAAAAHLRQAAEGALPEEELETGRILADRLVQRLPRNAAVFETAYLLEQMQVNPRRLERELHRAATSGSDAERAALSCRLGRLREIRLGDPEGAAAAYRDALRWNPAGVEALLGLERVLSADPASLLTLARSAGAATQDAAVLRQVHLAAARAAARAGDSDSEAEHCLLAFRAAPDDRALRRRALSRLKRAGRWLDVLEVLHAEAASGDRVGALLEGAEIIVREIGRPDAALPWAEDGLQAARETARDADIERAEALCARIRTAMESSEREPAPSPQPEEARADAPPETPREGADATEAAAGEEPVDDHPDVVEVVVTSSGATEWRTSGENGWARASDEAPPALDATDDEDLKTAKRAIAQGLVLEAQGRLPEAAAAYEKALSGMPRMREPLERLAQLYEMLGRREEAWTCVDRLLYIVEDRRERALLRARRASLTRDRDAAAVDLHEALTLAGDDRQVVDLCLEVSTVLELWELSNAAGGRRLRLIVGEGPPNKS